MRTRARYGTPLRAVPDIKKKRFAVPAGTLITVACSDCGAGLGEQCVAASGRTTTAHASRKRLAIRLLNESRS